jgi:hypothetical protein
MSMVLQKIDAGCSYRIENLWPRDTVLDSTFLDTMATGRPLLPIGKNSLSSFYVYALGKIAPFLSLGYSFAWSDSRNDQWIATRIEPRWSSGFPPRILGTDMHYSYYPYPTPNRTIGHLLVISCAVPIGDALLYSGKAAFPVYSRRDAYSSPETIPAGTTPEDPSISYYYTQEFTGPLTLESKLAWRANDWLTARLAYEYFCLPYSELAYFSKDSYSYHKAAIILGVEW